MQCLYERALAVFPVTHYLWLEYCRYLEVHNPTAAGPAYARAVRNCPWVGQLWARSLRALERGAATGEGAPTAGAAGAGAAEVAAATGAPAEEGAEGGAAASAPGVEQEHAALYQRALAAGLQGYEDYLGVVLARADCLRRRGPAAAAALREAFSEGSQLLQRYFPDQTDPALRLPVYWAECEARAGGGGGSSGNDDSADGLAAGREVWEGVLRGPAGRLLEAWAAYIDFERRRGHLAEARALYRRGCARRLEGAGQGALCEAWLRFEREEGRWVGAWVGGLQGRGWVLVGWRGMEWKV